MKILFRQGEKMQQTFSLRKFNPEDLQAVMQINRVCLPENYTDFFFIDLHQRFPETWTGQRLLENKHPVYALSQSLPED